MTDHEIITEAATRFPKEFGFRAFPYDKFRISLGLSYLRERGNPDSLMLYTQRLCEDGEWRDFAKGTETELKREMVKL
jgi:hypothetical protein